VAQILALSAMSESRMTDRQKSYFADKMPKVTAELYERLSTSSRPDLGQKKIIWIPDESKFVEPGDVAFDVPHNLNLSPYVRPLPKRYRARSLGPFFKLVGVQDTVNATHYRLILSKLALQLKLNRDQFDLALRIVQEIAKEQRERSCSDAEAKDDEVLFLPTEGGQLRVASEVMYSDGLMERFSELGDGKYFQVHPSISAADAELLGATPYSDILGESPFDQKVTTLGFIGGVLKQYLISDIFKEFIQNSDDAEASQFHIFFDNRHAETSGITAKHVLGEPCRAIYIFNNAQFSEADFVRLMSPLTEEHRKSAECIGHHVKGFNSCYGLTDTPMILSGNDLVVLDPLHIVWKTGGKRFNLRNKGVAKACPGLLTLFDEIKSIVQPSSCQAGTIFRFPLRTTASKMHNTSVVSPAGVASLADDFCLNAPSLLLYLRFVSCAKLTKWDPGMKTAKQALDLSVRHKSIPQGQNPLISVKESTFIQKSDPYTFMTATYSSWDSEEKKALVGAVSFPIPYLLLRRLYTTLPSQSHKE